MLKPQRGISRAEGVLGQNVEGQCPEDLAQGAQWPGGGELGAGWSGGRWKVIHGGSTEGVFGKGGKGQGGRS